MVFGHGEINESIQDYILIRDLLSIHPDLIVLWDKTFIKSMIYDLTQGSTDQMVLEKYKDCLYRYRVLLHEFQSLHLVLLPNNLKTCRVNLLGRHSIIPNILFWDFQEQKTIMDMYKIVNSHILSSGINIEHMEVFCEEKALDVHSKILKLLK